METEIEIKKNCNNCIKQSACKFHHTYKEFVNSKMFYDMFQHLEWNNLLKIFEDNAPQCKHYHQKFPNGKLILSIVGIDVFTIGMRQHLGDNLGSYTVTNDINKLTINTKDGSVVDPKIIENTYTVKVVSKLSENK